MGYAPPSPLAAEYIIIRTGGSPLPWQTSTNRPHPIFSSNGSFCPNTRYFYIPFSLICNKYPERVHFLSQNTVFERFCFPPLISSEGGGPSPQSGRIPWLFFASFPAWYNINNPDIVILNYTSENYKKENNLPEKKPRHLMLSIRCQDEDLPPRSIDGIEWWYSVTFSMCLTFFLVINVSTQVFIVVGVFSAVQDS